MPRTGVVFYQEAPGDVPALDWLRRLQRTDRRGYAKCVARVQRLAELGHELHRILYFFHGKEVAVLAAGLSKEGRVPDGDIDRALQRKVALEEDPSTHTFVMEL